MTSINIHIHPHDDEILISARGVDSEEAGQYVILDLDFGKTQTTMFIRGHEHLQKISSEFTKWAPLIQDMADRMKEGAPLSNEPNRQFEVIDG